MTEHIFSEWERELFRILANPNSTPVDITAVLTSAPATVSQAVHRIAVRIVEGRTPEQSMELPAEFTDATKAEEDRAVALALAWSQNPDTWSTTPELFGRHMDLADMLTDETLTDEKEFLMLAWEVLSDIRERLETEDTDDIDFERFDYFVNHIEELANL